MRPIGRHVHTTLPPRRAACPPIGRRQAARASAEGEPTARVDAVPTRRGALLGAAASAVLGTTPTAAQAGTAPFCGLFELSDGRQALPMYVYKLPWDESTIKFAGGETWTRVVGSAKEETRASKTLLPVVMLHGGPGLCSRYLEPMELLGQTSRRLVFYDQVAALSGAPSWSQWYIRFETLSAKTWDAPRSTAAASAHGTPPQATHIAWTSS